MAETLAQEGEAWLVRVFYLFIYLFFEKGMCVIYLKKVK